MTTPGDNSPHREQVLYRARYGLLMRILVPVLCLVVAGPFLLGAALALFVPERPNILLAVVCVGIMALGVCLLLLLLRPAFIVSTQGIEIRGHVGRERIPWERIAVIEVDRSLMNKGATVVVLHDGRHVTSALTGSRFALRRGESTFDHGPDLLQPARPTRAAIDAHRRWLAARRR